MAVAPPALRRGGTVALTSPSGPLAARCPRRLRRASAELERRGLRVRAGASTTWDDGRHAGAAADRARELAALLRDPDVRAIMTTVGGDGAADVLAHLDLDALAAHPKPLVGASDATALVVPAALATGVVTFLGPAALPQFGEADGCHPFTWSAFAAAVGGARAPLRLPATDEAVVEQLRWDARDDAPRRRERGRPRRTLRAGAADGVLVAGNLSTLAGLLERGWRPPLPAAPLLALEESDTAGLGRLRRNLGVLRDAGVLERAGGVAFGRLHQVETGTWPAEEADAVLLDAVAGVAGPVASDVEFGHVDPVLTLPIGVRARLRAGDTVTLEVLERPTA